MIAVYAGGVAGLANRSDHNSVSGHCDQIAERIVLTGIGGLKISLLGPGRTSPGKNVSVTRAIDAHLSIYQADVGRAYASEPRYRRKLDLPLDFETSRPKGFAPTFDFDLNADGRHDYLSADGGKNLEVFLGDAELGYGTRHAVQAVPTEGAVRTGDLNGDGLPDLVIFNPFRLDQSIYLVTNLARLEGTPLSLEPRAGSNEALGESAPSH